jgi:3',5'-cyclic AMP phosphodiesterase CpdA
VIGNHDSRAHWRTVFGPGRLNYTFERGHWRFIALDTSPGHLPEETVGWLNDRLREGGAKTAAILLHHPLVLSKQYTEVFKARYRGSPLLRNASEVLTLLREHGKTVRAVFCGHLHRAVRIGYGRLTMAVAPALVRPPAHRMYVVKVNGDDVKISSTSTARGTAW